MSKRSKTVKITMDNKVLQVKRKLTILQAAECNGIYIPTLCAHEALTPFGGCRMCIVEVEGMRGFPTACTTPVEEGMVIRTHTAQVQNERREILQLILSEHTSSCLICGQKDECREYMGTIRKAGVITGCRYCPNDGQCELQDVVEYLGLKEIDYPIYYRQLRVEKEDPFYDRDYNLCILCGRCIRMCQEIRMADVLAFKQRGRQTVIGPAYNRTHWQAGCEFCGACVSVCPTGALSEKARKWEGKAEREEVTTCSLCGVGCQVRLLIKGEKVIGSLPAEDPLVNDGQLCVKGRFCVTELVNNHRRLRKPYRTQNGAELQISWEQAIELAAKKLSDCPAERFGLLVSPNCTNEDLYVAQKFARVVMGSVNIDTTARKFYGPGFNAYLNLMRMSVPLADLSKASLILCVGLDTRFGRSVVGVQLRKAIGRGAKVITINPRNNNLTMIAEKWLQPAPDEMVHLLRSLVKLTEKKGRRTMMSASRRKRGDLADELSQVAEMLGEACSPVILVGSEFLQRRESPQILEAIGKLARNTCAGVLPLPAQSNLYGSVLMGAYPELLPGGFSSTDKGRADDLSERWSADIPTFPSRRSAEALLWGRKLKVLYLIGVVPPNREPHSDFTIFQNIYPSGSPGQADLVLPAAAFTETDGTSINGEGRIQRVRKAVHPPGEALPDWEILCRIARKLGKKGFDFGNVRQIHKEISRFVAGFGNFAKPRRKASPLLIEGELRVVRRKSAGKKRADKKPPFMMNVSTVEHIYRGFPLTDWVEGARMLFAEETVDVSPEDAKKLGISTGDEVVVSWEHFQKSLLARIVSGQQRGMLYATLRNGEFIEPNPHPVIMRKKDV